MGITHPKPVILDMLSARPTNKIEVHQQNISYYDEIAGEYDALLTQEDSNNLVRQRVKDQLSQALPTGTVLDFGGGTGLDLGWLSANQYQIIFCEPSAGMREKAIWYNNEVLHNHNIQFLDDTQTDFTSWQERRPFAQTVDAILANFGVLNAIPDIRLLFQRLSMVVKPGGHCLVVVLDRPLKKMWQWHRRNTVNTLLFRQPFVMYVWHNGHRQTVYVHSAKAIQQASAASFECREVQHIAGTSFILLHLVKK